MQKHVFILLLTFFSFATQALAGKDISVKHGNTASMKQQVGVSIVIDFSETMVVEYKHGKITDRDKPTPLKDYLKSRGDDYVRDWPSYVREAETMIASILRKTGPDYFSQSPTYELRFHIAYLDYGNSATGIISNFAPVGVKAGGMVISGTAEFVNLKTGIAECVFDFPIVEGMNSETDGGRVSMVFHTLGRAIKKLVNKGVQNGDAVPASKSKK